MTPGDGGPFPGYPGFPPGLVVAFAASAIVSGPLARRLRSGRGLAFCLTLSVGIIVAATLFPGLRADTGPGSGSIGQWLSCDLDLVGPSVGSRALPETLANVLLFIPLGLVVTLLPSRTRRLAVPTAVAAPFVIEMTQAVFVPLGRTCQVADVLANVAGIVIGSACGIVALRIRRRSSTH